MTIETNEYNKNLTKYLPWLLLLPITLLIVFCVMFFSDFPTYLGTEKSWLSTASIINGFVTPLLTSASIILIYLTWVTTKAELEKTSKQLSIQLKNEGVNRDLEAFSRRVKKLTDCFYEDKFNINSIPSPYVTWLLVRTVCDEDDTLNSFFNALPPDYKVREQDKYLSVLDYFRTINVTLNDCFHSFYSSSITGEESFIQVMQGYSPLYKVLTRNILCYSLCKKPEESREMKMFDFIVLKLNELDENVRPLFIDELEFVFDLELFRKIAQLRNTSDSVKILKLIEDYKPELKCN